MSPRLNKRFQYETPEYMVQQTYCLLTGKFVVMASGGWMGSYASVASLPAYFKMILDPPGCSEMVVSKDFPFGTMELPTIQEVGDIIHLACCHTCLAIER